MRACTAWPGIRRFSWRTGASDRSPTCASATGSSAPSAAATYRHYVETEVLAHWSTVKPAHRVMLEDGTELIASGDHRFLTGRGWKHVTGTSSGGAGDHISRRTTSCSASAALSTRSTACAEYRRGYLTGMVRGDANLKVYRYQRAGRTHGDVHRFRLALADVEGLDRTQDYLDRDGISTTGSISRAATRSAACNDRDPHVDGRLRGAHQCDCRVAARAHQQPGAAAFLPGFSTPRESESARPADHRTPTATILGPHPAALRRSASMPCSRTGGCRTALNVRLRGGLREHMRFVHLVDPAIRRKCSVDGTAVKSDADLRVVAHRGRSASRCRCTTSRPEPATSSPTASSATTASPGGTHE